MNSEEALELLLDGNERWVKGHSRNPNQDSARRAELATAQNPFAVVFSCVDSRVVPELVFDRGLGDLFVVRTAAHVIDDAALGSIEFGIDELHIPLLVVIGHKRCGAVSAAVSAAESLAGAPGKIAFLVEAILPAVKEAENLSGDRVDNVVRAHVANTVAHLQIHLANQELQRREAKIVGAYYDLASGRVNVIVD